MSELRIKNRSERDLRSCEELKQSTLLPGSMVIILLFCVLRIVWVRVVFGKTDGGA